MRKTLSVMVGALLLLTTASPGVGASTTPVMMSDGSVRYGVSLSQSPETDKFIISNYSEVPVTVETYDPTYGHGTVTLQPNYDSVVVCADEAYRETHWVTVTFNNGAADAASGTAKYTTVYTGAYDVALREGLVAEARVLVGERRAVVIKAKAKLKKARIVLRKSLATWKSVKSSGKPVLIKSVTRKVKIAKRKVEVAKRKVKIAKRRLESAKVTLASASSDLERALEEVSFCANRRVG